MCGGGKEGGREGGRGGWDERWEYWEPRWESEAELPAHNSCQERERSVVGGRVGRVVQWVSVRLGTSGSSSSTSAAAAAAVVVSKPNLHWRRRHMA